MSHFIVETWSNDYDGRPHVNGFESLADAELYFADMLSLVFGKADLVHGFFLEPNEVALWETTTDDPVDAYVALCSGEAKRLKFYNDNARGGAA